MTQRLFPGHPGQLFTRQGAEWPAGAGEHQPSYLGPILAGQALPDGRVLAVNRKQPGPLFLLQSGYQGTSHYQAFLVGKSNIHASLESRHGRGHPSAAHQPIEAQVDIVPTGDFQQAGSTGIYHYPGAGQPIPELIGTHRISQSHCLYLELPGLVGKQLHVAVGGEGYYPEFPGKIRHHLQGLGAYRAGGT